VDDQIEPADAARALSEIGRRREQVIRRASAVPGRFWWAVAVLNIAFVADYESQRGALYWTGIALYAAGTLALTGLQMRASRRVPLRDDQVPPGSVPRILASAAAFVAVMIGVALATVLSLEAARVPYPGTITSAVVAVAFVAGGKMLTRYQTAVLVGRPGGRG
jgi:hypothetical protein